MRKKLLLWSLLLCIAGGAFTAAFATALTSTWKVTSETAVAAESTYLDDDLLTVKTVYATTLKEQAATIDGVAFTHYIQVRNAAYPSADVPTGTENTGSTSLVVTAKKNAKLKLYYRHQSASTKKDDGGNVTSVSHTQNDGKDLKVFDQGNPAVALEGDFVIHTEEALAEYKYVTKEIELLKDHVYTLSAKGTTLPFYGLSAEEIEDIVIPTDGVYYQKVTSSEDITDGDYLIVYEAEKVAFDGSLQTLDAVKNTVGVTISNGLIASSKEVDAAVFTFNLTEMSIKSASGFYVGITSYSNGLKQNATLSDKFKHDSFEIDESGDVIIKKIYDGDSGGDVILNFNSNANDKRFRYYKGGSQKKIQLYKKIAPAPAVATPVISGETPFVGSTTVTITCETEGATIYYTTDGTDPTNESTKYIEPFELSASATVKAIAYDVTGANSEIVSKEFVATPAVATIAALNALENGTSFAYTGEALVVAKAANENKTYVYIKDETGSSLIYDADASKTANTEVGKTIAANWTGKVSIFKNLFEAVPDAALSVKDGDAVEVTYPEAQLTDVKADNVSQVVELKGVTYTLDGKSLTISQGEAETAGYNQFGMEIAAAEEGKTYNIVGAIGRYNDNIQFWPISIEVAQSEPAAQLPGDVIWSRTEPVEATWYTEEAYDINIGAVVFGNAKVGDKIHVLVNHVTEGLTEDWQAQVSIDDGYWTILEKSVNVGLGDVKVASFVLTGDMLRLIQANGMKIAGSNFSTSMISLESCGDEPLGSNLNNS